MKETHIIRTSINNTIWYKQFKDGFQKGIPIALGYIPVSFTFGLMSVSQGLSIGLTIFISLSNLTSAGQFAGLQLIVANSSLFEIGLTTLIINLRYMLMSLSLSQKLKKGINFEKRGIIAFGITDETFSIAALEEQSISFSFMAGLILCPYFGWGVGTALGAISSSLLPQNVQSAMGIALYAMFIALVVPVAKKSKAALVVTILAIFLSSCLTFLPFTSNLSSGWRIMISTAIACSVGALIFPKEEDEL